MVVPAAFFWRVPTPGRPAPGRGCQSHRGRGCGKCPGRESNPHGPYGPRDFKSRQGRRKAQVTGLGTLRNWHQLAPELAPRDRHSGSSLLAPMRQQAILRHCGPLPRPTRERMPRHLTWLLGSRRKPVNGRFFSARQSILASVKGVASSSRETPVL